MKPNQLSNSDTSMSADIVSEREERVKKINTIALAYYQSIAEGQHPSATLVMQLEKVFGISEQSNPQVWKALLFTLEAFRHPLGGKMTRKDGGPIVSHSLELMRKAQSFGINDADVLITALLHDALEDTETTAAQIDALGLATGSATLPTFVHTFTEIRQDGKEENREKDHVIFMEQLREAKGIPVERKHVVAIVEILDRMDDLSDLGYLTKDLGKPEKAQKARLKLGEKLGKCRDTIDAVTEGVDDQTVLALKEKFDALYDYIQRTYEVPATIIGEQLQAYDKMRDIINLRTGAERVPSEIVQQGIAHALSIIDAKYSALPFHNKGHTEKDVIPRVEKILIQVISSSEDRFGSRLIDLGKIAAAFHDVEREYKKPKNDTEKETMVVRYGKIPENNEEVSADEAIAWMRSCNVKGKEMFTEKDMSIVHDAIMATVPAFPDGKFKQPHLFPKTGEKDHLSPVSRLVATSLALADVAVPGLEGFASYKAEGNRRFREWPAGKAIQEELAHTRLSDIPIERQSEMKAKILAWLKEQVRFAEHLRNSYMERVLSLLDEGSRQSMTSMFSQFEEAITGSEQLLAKAQNKDMWPLAKEMGFEMLDA